ncbi:MAG: S8 family serine peptidase [Acidobacteriota bacterium]
MRTLAVFVVFLVLAPIHALAEKVGAPVLEALDQQGEALVVIVYDLEAPVENLASPLGRAAIREHSGRILDRLSDASFTLRHRYKAINALAGTITREGLDQLLEEPLVRRVDLDVGGQGQLGEAVVLAGFIPVWNAGFTGAGVTVAVLDSGIDSDHPDLSSSLSGEACFCFDNGAGCCPNGATTQMGTGSGEDDHGHGTNVIGVITSDGIVAPSGGAPDADIVSIKVLDENNSFCCTSDVVAGLDYILTDRPEVDLVNMSLGTFATFPGNCDTATSFTMALAAAIDTLWQNGVVSFVATGNGASGTDMSAPACVANAVSVGAVYDSDIGGINFGTCSDATTAPDQVTCFSNSNDTTDLFSPGAPMTSSGLGGGTSTFFGTSQASPLSAACAALLLDAFPGMTPTDIENALEDSPTLVTDTTNGLSFPRLDCGDAFDNGPIFTDGFESGDTSAWSSTVD